MPTLAIAFIPLVIGGERYCIEGIQTRFQMAVDSEEHWPPRFGDSTISIDDFAGALDADLINRYRAQERIHNAGAPLMRAFCPWELPETVVGGVRIDPAERCNEFLGRRMRDRIGNWCQRCERCAGDVCMVCSDEIGSRPGDRDVHECGRSVELQKFERMWTGRDRGYDYQFCPRCWRVNVLISDEDSGGCNHIQ